VALGTEEVRGPPLTQWLMNEEYLVTT